MLKGDLPLPWEGELSAHQAQQLGPFRVAVMQLLQRDPAQRAGMLAFHRACTDLFGNHSTMRA